MKEIYKNLYLKILNRLENYVYLSRIIFFFILIYIIIIINQRKQTFYQLRQIINKDNNSKIFICNHNHLLTETFLSWFFLIPYQISNKVTFITNEPQISKILKNNKIPFCNFLVKNNKSITNQMIDILKKKESIIIYYKKETIYMNNIHKIIQEFNNDIDIIPLKIIKVKKKYNINLLKKINYKKDWEKEKFIEVITNNLY